MKIHTQWVSYIGAVLFFAGVTIDYSHFKQDVIVYFLMTLGIIMMLLGFRKTEKHNRNINVHE